MTTDEQAQAEAKEMIEGYYNLNYEDDYVVINLPVAVKAAEISINKLLSLRVQPLSYYELVKEKIISYQ